VQSAVARIEQELAPGERVLWTGQPRQGVRFRAADIFLIPFSIAWLGFAIFWTTMATRITRPAGVPALNVIFPLFGIPFILMGIYLTVGRFWLDARRRARTFYAITTYRIFALNPSRNGGTRSLDLKHLDEFTVTENRDRSGRIVFTPSNIRSFDEVPNIREVEAILRNAHQLRRTVPGR
jgi:hypothetical protein